MALEKLLVDHITSVTDSDLSRSTARATKRVTLDTLGAILTGQCAENADTLRSVLTQWGVGETTLLGTDQQVTLGNAVFGNCTYARSYEHGDMHVLGGGHLSESIVPVACNLAETADMSGDTFLRAVAMGEDVQARVRMPLPSMDAWLSETYAPFGVAATVAVGRGFDAETTHNALGLAYSQCGANGQGFLDGVHSVRLQQGMAAKAGVEAADLAEAGFTGIQRFLEGKYGFYNWYGGGEYDADQLTDGIGKHFEIENVSVKPYAGCKQTHTSVAAALKLLDRYDLDPEAVETVHLTVNSIAYDTCGPVDEKTRERKYRPRTVVDAQFSLPYTVATALIERRGPRPEDFMPETITDERRLAMAERVTVEAASTRDSSDKFTAPSTITVTTAAGKEYEHTTRVAPGHPDDPFTWDEVVDRFLKFGAFAGIPEDILERIVGLVKDLGKLDDAAVLMETLQEGTSR